MKFYVCKKNVTNDYVILTGIKYHKKDNDYEPQIYTRFFKKLDYENIKLNDTKFPFIVDFKNEVTITNAKD